LHSSKVTRPLLAESNTLALYARYTSLRRAGLAFACKASSDCLTIRRHPQHHKTFFVYACRCSTLRFEAVRPLARIPGTPSREAWAGHSGYKYTCMHAVIWLVPISLSILFFVHNRYRMTCFCYHRLDGQALLCRKAECCDV
jgi:hypothetical protein